MYPKKYLKLWRRHQVRRWTEASVKKIQRRLVRHGLRGVWHSFMAGLVLAANLSAKSAPLMQESFNYNVGTSLAGNPPWAGTLNASLSIAAGNLTVTNLRSISPAGNNLKITSGATANAYRSFSATPATSGAVYCSFLLNCITAPTNSQFVFALLPSGTTSASPPDDPLDLYVFPVAGGYSFTILCEGSDPASAGTILSTNSTHFIVVKYTFGSIGNASIYIDPPTGGAESFNPDASTQSDDDNTGASSLQVVLFRASSSRGQGDWNFDTLRVGTAWEDVTPLTAPLTLSGPQDQAVCSGGSAIFTVTANGTPPYFYTWRTNSIPVPGATNSFYQLSSPGPADVSNLYDVIVQDSFGTTTSQVARLMLSSVPAQIAVEPTNQIVVPTSTNAVFTVVAAGDAPIAYQWRTNGIIVPGATNSTLTITNPTAVDPTILYDVIVSNPCLTVTSTPPALLVFPNVFYEAFDAGPGFFSGENLVLTNKGGLSLQSWSSPSLSAPITQWTLEGPLQEQPLNDGTGRSFYSINVTPAASPVYYIFGSSTLPPYLSPVPILTITTDASGFYLISTSSTAISPGGALGAAPILLQVSPHPGGGLDFTGAGVAGNNYVLQAAANFQIPINWLPLQTNSADTNGLIHFVETNTPSPGRFYRVVGQ